MLESFTLWSLTLQNRSDGCTRHSPDRNSADVVGAAVVIPAAIWPSIARHLDSSHRQMPATSANWSLA